MSLYKYVASADSLKFLLDGACRFTPIGELNDPSELTANVVFEEVVASLARLREAGYTDGQLVQLRQQERLLQRLAPGLQAVPAPSTKQQANRLIRSSVYDNVLFLENRLSETATEISSKVGVFCLSRRFDSLPMWAHYAGNASGLVIEFTGLDAVFPGDETGVLWQTIPVRYERDIAGVTFDPSSHESLFFSKFRDWSYEEEVRVVLPLSDCRKVEAGKRPLWLFDVPRSCIRRVILGWKVGRGEAESVFELVRERSPSVEVSWARFHRGRVVLDPPAAGSRPAGRAT